MRCKRESGDRVPLAPPANSRMKITCRRSCLSRAPLLSPDSPLTGAFGCPSPGWARSLTKGGDRALAVVGVVQVDQRGPGAGMAHAGHQFAQASPGDRGQDVTGMAQVVEVDLGQTCLGGRWQPHAAAEVAAP